jgi:hypothetical protein
MIIYLTRSRAQGIPGLPVQVLALAVAICGVNVPAGTFIKSCIRT